MHIIKDELFEAAQKRYAHHCLDIVLVACAGAYEGISGHKKAVICAMTSAAFADLTGQAYKRDDFNLALMECERVEASEFFKLCKVTQKRSHKAPLMEYSDGYISDDSYAVGTLSGDVIKIMYSYAWLNPPHPTNYSPRDFESFNDALFPNGRDNLEICRWKDNFCDKYFLPGKEWWGTGLWSVYDKTMDRFAVIGASQTD